MKGYGDPARFGPYRWQAIRLVGRLMERFGAWLDAKSWGFR